MNRDELLNKEVIKLSDIQKAYEVSYYKACEIIRAIKSYNDRLEIRGVVHILDYIEYFAAKSKYNKNLNKD